MATVDPIDIITEEFNEIEKNGAWNQVYLKVRTEGMYDLSCSSALTSINKNLNRYKDVLPYDHSRIILQNCVTDYINASLVEVESVGRKYILCQGPLSHTTTHFWLLMWQQKTEGIVMLNKIIEKNQIKCHQYWPLGEKRGVGNTMDFPSINLKVELVKEVPHSHYIYRTLRLTNTETMESRIILHFHYTTWSDFGVPQSPDAFLHFLKVVRSSGVLRREVGPAVVHCSAGIGRSGTFCLVDSILLMLEQEESWKTGKMLEVLLDMRRYRMGLIQTPDQLRFSYQAIIYGATHDDNETNGKAVSEPSSGVSSEEVSLEEPPPPPPRGTSLSRGHVTSSPAKRSREADATAEHNHNHDEDEDSDDSDDTDASDVALLDDDDERPLVNNSATRSLPCEPAEKADVNGATSPHDQNSCAEDEASLRRRTRQQRVAATSAKVAEIRERAAGAERWEEKRRWMAPSVTTLTAIVVAALGVYYYYR